MLQINAELSSTLEAKENGLKVESNIPLFTDVPDEQLSFYCWAGRNETTIIIHVTICKPQTPNIETPTENDDLNYFRVKIVLLIKQHKLV